MSYTLKLDWPAYRLGAVVAVLDAFGPAAAKQDLALWLPANPDDEFILKLDWSDQQIEAVCAVLTDVLKRPYDNDIPYHAGMPVRELIAQVDAASTDIRTYREAVAEATRKG